jgi:hypothetical protein
MFLFVILIFGFSLDFQISELQVGNISQSAMSPLKKKNVGTWMCRREDLLLLSVPFVNP